MLNNTMIIITIITRPKVENVALFPADQPDGELSEFCFVFLFESERFFPGAQKRKLLFFVVAFKVDEPFNDYSEKCYSFSDPVLAKTLFNCGQWVTKLPFPHESLLINENNTKLSKNEKRAAKKGKISVIFENHSNLASST